MTVRPFKIGIAGAHSTGKSTFIDELQSRLSANGLRVAVIRDLARAARSAGLPILGAQTVDTALWIVAEGIRREVEACLEHDVVLADRAVFDAVGYLEAAFAHSGRQADLVRIARVRNLAIGYSQDYDAVVVTVLDPEIPLGPGRDSDLVFRRLAGERIQALTLDLGRPFHLLTPATREVLCDDLTAGVRAHFSKPDV